MARARIFPEDLQCEHRSIEANPTLMVAALVSYPLLCGRELKLQRRTVARIHHHIGIALELTELTTGCLVGFFDNGRFHIQMTKHFACVGLSGVQQTE